MFAALAALKVATDRGVPALLRPFTLFGRVPFFFYIVHFYVLALAMGILRTKVDLGGTYAIWIGLLLVMAGPCAWYFEKKQQNSWWITRYL